MLILSDFVDFESSAGYFNNYKLVMSQYIIQKPPPPPPPPPSILKSKAPPHGKEKLAKAQRCQVMLGGYQLV